MVEEFQDIFQEELRLTQGVTHHIHTPLREVIQEHWRCLPQRLHEEVKQEIEHMVAKGIIERDPKPVAEPLGNSTKTQWLPKVLCRF